MKLRFVSLVAALVFAAAPVALAQSTPALQYVPVVNLFAGGATTSTLCAGATDTLGDGCPATQTILSGPTTGDTDAAGNVYFPDAGNNVVRRIDAVTGIVTLVAGEVGSTAMCSGATDTIGDGCLATQAPLNNPRCVRIDRAGNIVIADVGNQVIRRIDATTGVITLLMGGIGKTTHTPPKNTAPSTPLTTTLYNPYNFVFDPAGNMIVTNSTGDFLPIALEINGVIDPNNSKVYDLAGTGAASTGAATDGNGGLATAATFSTPRGLALDAAGNLYIGDYNDNQVRVVSSPGMNGQVTASNIIAGTVNNVAGTGTQGTTGNGGPAVAAELSFPQGLGFDNAGTIYIEQYSSGNDFIRSLNPMVGTITNYAGTGAASYTGDGGPAAQATFYTPTALKVNIGNRMLVFDQSNSRLRNINPSPFFSAVAVGQTASQNAAFQANVAATPMSASTSNGEFTVGTASGCTLGSAMAAAAYCKLPITFTPAGPGLRAGQLTVTDGGGTKYTAPVLGVGLAPAGAFAGAQITTLAGNGTAGSSGNNAAASAALVNAPRGGALDGSGNFYFADSANHVVREIVKSTGSILLVAGTNGSAGFSGDGASATAAQLNTPSAVAVDAAGNLYIADAGNNRIREVVAATGKIATIAGTGTAGFSGDTGLATLATLNDPTGLALDNAGVVYVADTGNDALRAFYPGGVMVTLAGTGSAGYSGDGGVPQLAQLNAPEGVTVDGSGNIYIADTGNAVVRKLTPIASGIISFQGLLSTYAGIAGGTTNSGDGGVATSAYLLSPAGVATDAAGDLYIAAGGQVRLVTPAGIITTIAGSGAAGAYSGEGGSAISAVIPSPAQAIAADQVGNLYLSDTAGNRVLSIAGSNAATLNFGSQTIATTSSPQSVTFFNSGNEPLTISNIAIPMAYALTSSGSAACSNSTTLPPAASCTLTLTFTPPSVANYTSQITITDNALNNSSSTQTIPLAGVGVGHLNPTTTIVSYSPTTPTYGQTVTLTATVTGTPTPTGKVNFIINTSTTVQGTLTNGVATYQLTGLMAGNDSVTANYLGDANDAGSTGSTTFTVAPAILTVTADNQTKYPTQANPTLTYTISGFVNNETAAKVVSGAAAVSTTATTSSAPGSYPITVAQGTLSAANYTFTFVGGTLTVLPPTFTLTLTPTSLTIAAGQVGATTATITPSPGYNGTVTLSCGTLPSLAVCTFNSTTLTVDPSGPQSTQLTISTNGHPEVAGISGRSGLLMMLLGVPVMALLFRRKRMATSLLLGVLAAAAMQSMAGCAPADVKSPSFSGMVVITATDKAANITQTANLGLNVQ